MRRLRGSAGQASVELVAVLPLVVALTAVIVQVLAAGLTRELADGAAAAGAAALVRDADPVAEARAALPGWSRRGIDVRVRGRTVTVRVRPVLPAGPLAGLLTAQARAHAGPGAQEAR